MTRQIAVVNLSNWDGEDYVVAQEYRLKPTRLKPGESIQFVPNDKPITAEPVQEAEPEPFRAPMMTNGGQRKGQVLPHMKTWFS